MTDHTTFVIAFLIITITAGLGALAWLVDRSSYAAGFQDGVAHERARGAKDRATTARTVRPIAGGSCSLHEFGALLDADIRRATRDPRTPDRMMKDVRA